MRDWKECVRANLGKLRVSPEREAGIVAELAEQLDQTCQSALARGASEAAAEAEARAQFPDWQALVREIHVSVNSPAPIEYPRGDAPARPWTGLLHDFRFAARKLRGTPSFFLIAAATLAFTIGGNTAIFSVADDLTLRGLPYKNPAGLIAIETRKTNQPEIEPWTSALDFFDMRSRTRTFQSISAISPVWSMVMTGQGAAQRLECLFVSAEFFPTLGVKAVIGRTFQPSEDHGTEPSSVIVVSNSFWQRRLGADPAVIGRAIALDAGTYTIAGVLPASFRYLGDPVAGTVSDIDIWLPLASNPMVGTIRGVRYLKLIGRLAPGASAAGARDEMRSLGIALAAAFPASNRGFDISVTPLSDQVAGRTRLTMILLVTTAAFVLLMACANVASLFLARATARERETSVRVALGATPWRLIRLMLAETLLVAVAGGGGGLLLAEVGVRAFVAAAPPTLVHNHVFSLDTRVLLFNFLAVTVSALVSGLPPAMRLLRVDIAPALRAAGRGIASVRNRWQGALVVAQIATALVLLTGAALLVWSFIRLLDVNPGFDARNVATISTQVPPSAAKPPERAAVYQRMRTQLENVPGVVAVGAVSRLPLLGRSLGSWIFVEGKTSAGDPPIDVEYRVATESYFAAMGIPLRAGRLFNAFDDVSPASAVLINETAARRFWPGEPPLGKRIKLGANPERQAWITVVGVVGDIRHVGLDTEVLPEVYRPYSLNPLFAPILVVHTAQDPASTVGTLVTRVQSVSPEIPAYDVHLVRELVDRSTEQRRFIMGVLTGFALAALLLAGIGVFGMMSRMVVSCTPELGVRMALGASPGAAARLVVNQGARLAGIGILVGTAGAAALTRTIRAMLFHVDPLDPAAFALAACALILFAAAACYVRARRAMRVDPVIALRQED